MLKTYCISKVEPMELTGKVDFRCEEKRSYLIFQNTYSVLSSGFSFSVSGPKVIHLEISTLFHFYQKGIFFKKYYYRTTEVENHFVDYPNVGFGIFQ